MNIDTAPEDACSSEAAAPDEKIVGAVPADVAAGFETKANRRPRHSSTLLRRLMAMATAQYVIVALLVGLAAVMVARQASQAINAKLSAIILAIKQF